MPEDTPDKPLSSPGGTAGGEVPQVAEEPPLILRTLQWISDYSGLSIRTLRHWASQNLIPGAVDLPGRTYRYHDQDLKAWLTARNTLQQLDKYDPNTTQVLWVFWTNCPPREDCDKLCDYVTTRVRELATVEQSPPLGRPRQFNSPEIFYKMKPDDKVFEQAVPHEAGHVIMAYSFGIPVKQIAYLIRSGSSGHVVSQIADPRRASSEAEKQAHCLVASGGIAGEVVATGKFDDANLNPRNADNIVLRMLAGPTAELTDYLKPAQKIIERKRQAFDSLCSALKERYPAVRDRIIARGQPGTYPLLVRKDLDEILGNVTPKRKTAGET